MAGGNRVTRHTRQSLDFWPAWGGRRRQQLARRKNAQRISVATRLVCPGAPRRSVERVHDVSLHRQPATHRAASAVTAARRVRVPRSTWQFGVPRLFAPCKSSYSPPAPLVGASLVSARFPRAALGKGPGGNARGARASWRVPLAVGARSRNELHSRSFRYAVQILLGVCLIPPPDIGQVCGRRGLPSIAVGAIPNVPGRQQLPSRGRGSASADGF